MRLALWNSDRWIIEQLWIAGLLLECPQLSDEVYQAGDGKIQTLDSKKIVIALLQLC